MVVKWGGGGASVELIGNAPQRAQGCGRSGSADAGPLWEKGSTAAKGVMFSSDGVECIGGDCELRVRVQVGDVLRVTITYQRQERSVMPRRIHSACIATSPLPVQFRCRLQAIFVLLFANGRRI